MKRMNSLLDAAEHLLNGEIGVIRTDTIYGVVGLAKNKAVVERIYRLKSRDEQKSPIILIGSIEDMYEPVTPEIRQQLESIWPDKVSLIVPSPSAPRWLERGNKSLAYRLPADTALQRLIAKTGPLIAPSANPQGQVPAMNIAQAQSYFGEQVDFYVDGGQVTDNTPSRLYRLSGDELERLR